MKTVLFFLRNFANIDHHAPYIYFLEKSKKCKIELLLKDINYNYSDNIFIQYFNKSKKIKIINLKNHFQNQFMIFSFIFHIISFFSKFLPKKISIKINNKIKKIRSLKFENFLISYYSEYINDNYNGVFDYSKSPSTDFQKLLKTKGGTSINLAHWVWMWKNQLRIDSMLEFTKTNETVGFFHKYDKCIIETNNL